MKTAAHSSFVNGIYRPHLMCENTEAQTGGGGGIVQCHRGNKEGREERYFILFTV